MLTVRRKLLANKVAGDNIPYKRKTYRIDVDQIGDPSIKNNTVRMALTTGHGRYIVGQFLTYKIIEE